MAKTTPKRAAAASAGKRFAARKAAPKRKPTRKKARPKAPEPSLRYRPGPAIDCEDALATAIAALTAQDPQTIAHLLEIGGHPPLRKRDAGLAGLAWIVISQQVSTASANAIHRRFIDRFPQPDAAAILAATDDELKSCGLSTPKIRTLRAVCEAIASGALDFGGLPAMEAHEAHAALVAIKGIGPWTADIFLLFSLGHPDAWPVGDLALQEAAKIALGLKTRPDAAKLEKLGERWRPWRGAAARLLWAYYGGVKQRQKEAAGA